MIEILRDFMLTPAPSGYEHEMAVKLKRALDEWCDEVCFDRMGNVLARINGERGDALPRAMVFAHMDSLGFVVRRVDENGYLQLDRLGGVPEKVLPGQSVLVRDEDGGWHPGVIGVKSHHAAPPEEKYKADQIGALRVDMGAASAAEINAMGIYTGCPAVYAPAFTQLNANRVSGTWVDNRGGCAALVQIARELSATRPQCDVYIAGTVWEEFNLRGAMMAARTIKPDIALSLDITLAGDTGDLCGQYDDKLGAGACVQLYSFHGRGTLNGTITHEPLFKLIKRAAREEELGLQRFSTVGMLTDAAYLQLEGLGVACVELGFPARYAHTPVETCDIRDLRALSKIAARALRLIDESFPLSRYPESL